MCIYRIYATAYIIHRYYAISITIFFVVTWYRKFFVEIVKYLFSCAIHVMWKITFVMRIQILGHGFTFLVAARRSVRYNTLTFNRYSDTFARHLRYTYMPLLNLCDIKNKWWLITNYIFRIHKLYIQAQYHVESCLARFELVTSVRFNPIW